jgi:hypothetical protein
MTEASLTSRRPTREPPPARTSGQLDLRHAAMWSAENPVTGLSRSACSS